MSFTVGVTKEAGRNYSQALIYGDVDFDIEWEKFVQMTGELELGGSLCKKARVLQVTGVARS